MLLVITNREKTGHTIVPFLCKHNVILYQCSLRDGERYCDEKDIGGVILDAVSDPSQGEALYRILQTKYPQMPIAVLLPPPALKLRMPDLPPAHRIYDDTPQSLLEDCLQFCIQECGWREAPLSTYYLHVGKTNKDIVYMGSPLKLPPKAHRILYCLFYRTPRLTSAEDLMQLCYPEGNRHESNLAVQIHLINHRAAQIDPRPLIVNVYGKGYRLRDGIL